MYQIQAMGGEALQLKPIHVLFMSTHLQAERVLSFIPPDGAFKLLSYQIGSQRYVHTVGPVGQAP